MLVKLSKLIGDIETLVAQGAKVKIELGVYDENDGNTTEHEWDDSGVCKALLTQASDRLFIVAYQAQGNPTTDKVVRFCMADKLLTSADKAIKQLDYLRHRYSPLQINFGICDYPNYQSRTVTNSQSILSLLRKYGGTVFFVNTSIAPLHVVADE